MTYIFVSGAGTGNSPQMWARVKRQTESDLQQMGFRQVFCFRPAIMRHTKGQLHVKKMDRLLGFFFPLMRFLTGGNTLEDVGRAMIAATERGYGHVAIEVADIKRLAERPEETASGVAEELRRRQ